MATAIKEATAEFAFVFAAADCSVLAGGTERYYLGTVLASLVIAGLLYHCSVKQVITIQQGFFKDKA